MLVKYWMSRNLVTVKTTDSVIKAQILLKKKIMEKATILYMIDHRENIRKIYINGTPSSD